MRSFISCASLIVIIMAIGCGGSSGGSTPSNDVDVNTLDGKSGIATDASFRYSFSGTVDSSKVTTSSYFIVPRPLTASISAVKAAFDPTICDAANALEAAVTASGAAAILTPVHDLAGGTGYAVCLTSDITVAGSTITAFMASFTTEGGGSTQNTRFRITNSCAYPIWVQQDSTYYVKPQFVQLAAGAHQDYAIPDGGQASTRFWAKKDCDTDGQNCRMGQSIAPCPAVGCAPPVDSKIEATWGCVLDDPSVCNTTPQGDKIVNTFYDSSAVDGYTFPYTIKITEGTVDDSCVNIDCSGLKHDKCPFDENLSQGKTQTYPAYAHENLAVLIPETSDYAGCFAPCQKLDYPGYGGIGLQNPESDQSILYCCPTPPITSEECRAGPVATSEYVTAIHEMCPGGGYGYAYDDNVGNHNCPPETKIEMTFGPNCP